MHTSKCNADELDQVQMNLLLLDQHILQVKLRKQAHADHLIRNKVKL